MIRENRQVVPAMLNALCFGLGCVMHGAAAIVLVAPIVMPLVRRKQEDSRIEREQADDA